jgi:hypothetical protein
LEPQFGQKVASLPAFDPHIPQNSSEDAGFEVFDTSGCW